ncbi:AAEL005731-PA, partial [Aedes aegypti]
VGDNCRQQRHGASRRAHAVRHQMVHNESDKPAKDQTRIIQRPQSLSSTASVRSSEIAWTATTAHRNREGTRGCGEYGRDHQRSA